MLSAFLFVVVAQLFLSSFSYASEKLYVQHAPQYLKFTSNNEVLNGVDLPELISAAQGFTGTKGKDWGGLTANKNPFQRPKAVVVAELDGYGEIDLDIPKINYPYSTVDITPDSSFELISYHISERYPEDELTLLEIRNDMIFDGVKSQYLDKVSAKPEDLKNHLMSESSSFLGGKPLKYLNVSYTCDLANLLDMQYFFEVSNVLKSKGKSLVNNKTPDLFWFQSSSLQGVISKHGSDSPQAAESVTLIKDVISKIDGQFNEIYGDPNYLFLVLTVDYQTTKSKSRRSLLAESLLGPSIPTSDQINRSPDYDEDYPAIFNIIFFIMLIIALSIFAIALGMWHIDPGRDSIIYRMTSQRIKKDQ